MIEFAATLEQRGYTYRLPSGLYFDTAKDPRYGELAQLHAEGQREAARMRWESVSDLTRLLFAEPSPAPAKYWLARTGLIESAEVRLPMVEVGAELAARLDAEIARRNPSLTHCVSAATG